MGTSYSKEVQKVILKRMTIGREYIRVYKVVKDDGDNYYPVIYDELGSFKYGIMKPENPSKLNIGFNAFTDYKSAEYYLLPAEKEKIIECLAKPEWVVDIGFTKMKNTILLNKLCFPKYPNTKVTVREFRKEVRKDN